MRVLWACCYALNNTIKGVGQNGRPCFHLTASFLNSKWGPQIWLLEARYMLAHYWVILSHVDGSEGVVLLWECCETVVVPPCIVSNRSGLQWLSLLLLSQYTIIFQLWVWWALRFNFGLKRWLITESTTDTCWWRERCFVLIWECCETVSIPPTSLQLVCATLKGMCSCVWGAILYLDWKCWLITNHFGRVGMAWKWKVLYWCGSGIWLLPHLSKSRITGVGFNVWPCFRLPPQHTIL